MFQKLQIKMVIILAVMGVLELHLKTRKHISLLVSYLDWVCMILLMSTVIELLEVY